MRQPKKKKHKSDDQLRADFLVALSQTANVCAACKAAKLPRPTAYNWRKDVPDFAKAWREAMELGTDALEDEAIRRAAEGTLRPIFQGGKLVGKTREYSDTLLIFMLKARRPGKFKDRVAHVGEAATPIQVKHEHTSAIPESEFRRLTLADQIRVLRSETQTRDCN